MIINFHTLLRLPVYTESEVRLGKIFDFELDVTTQTVARYLVRANILSAKSFVIANTQVKEIKNDKVIVYDSVLKSSLSEAVGILSQE